MSQPFNYSERSAAVRANLQAKREEQKHLFGQAPKVEQPKVLAEMFVLGKTVADWAKEVASLMEMADDQRRATGKLVVLDMSEHFPATVVYAVERWEAAGRPTEYDDTAHKLQRLRDEAEKYAALAINDDNKAEKFEELKNAKKVAQHRKYAQTNRDKAAKFLEQAETLAAEYKKEHP